MDAREILGQARDAMSVKRVFGEPYEKDGVTVIPVAKIMGGAGAGSGPVAKAGADAIAGEPGATPQGSGWGYGLGASPAGVYVIRGSDVEWKPAIDVNRLAVQRAVVVVVGLLVARSFIKALSRR
jgi:uncharacterized spore protein YtfJ